MIATLEGKVVALALEETYRKGSGTLAPSPGTREQEVVVTVECGEPAPLRFQVAIEESRQIKLGQLLRVSIAIA